MKKFIFIVCVMLSTSAFAGKQKPHHYVHVRASRDNVFYFKVDAEFVGADIEVYNEKEEVIFTYHISHKKALIDFYYETPGTYKIRFVKGSSEEKFDYVKVDESPATSIGTVAPISVVEDI